MRRPPRPKDEPIMSRASLMRYSLTGLYVGLATVGPLGDGMTYVAIRGPGDLEVTEEGRRYQKSEYVNRWMVVQGLDWLRRALLGQMASPADWR